MGEGIEKLRTAEGVSIEQTTSSHKESDLTISDLPREHTTIVEYKDARDENGEEDIEKVEKDDGSLSKSEEPPRGVLGFIDKKADQFVDWLETKCVPFLKKPLVRITIGCGMTVGGIALLAVGVPLLLSPIPGGIVLVPLGAVLTPVGLGLIFGAGPKAAWRTTKNIWNMIFKKKNNEAKNKTA